MYTRFLYNLLTTISSKSRLDLKNINTTNGVKISPIGFSITMEQGFYIMEFEWEVAACKTDHVQSLKKGNYFQSSTKKWVDHSLLGKNLAYNE